MTHATSRARPGDRGGPTWASALAVTAVVFAVLGVLVGWLWSQLGHPAEYAVYHGAQGPVAYYASEAEFGHDFDVDLTYAWLGAVAALVGGGITGWRHWRLGWTVTVLAGLGAVLGAALAWWLGGVFGPPSVESSLAGAQVGDTFTAPVELGARSIALIWPVASLVGVMVSVWLRAPRDEYVAGTYAYAFDTEPAEPSSER